LLEGGEERGKEVPATQTSSFFMTAPVLTDYDVPRNHKTHTEIYFTRLSYLTHNGLGISKVPEFVF
jgi:hypothetical protein